MTEPSKRYRAFISYSRVDKRQASRIQRALERYRLPRGISEHFFDPRTRRLGRFFRDDDELGASADLGAALRGAIADSESLIVICSPHAANSRWVNEEILHFKRTGREKNIFAVILEGVPNAEDPELECFAPALRISVDADGNLTNRPAEVLGLDIRKERFARLCTRLASGLLNLSFDDLWRREKRRLRFQRAVYAGAILFVLAAAITANFYISFRSDVDRLALEAQELIEQRSYSVAGRGASNEPLIGQRRIHEALPFAIAALPENGRLIPYSGQVRDCGSFGLQPAGRCASLRISFAIPRLSPGNEPSQNADTTFSVQGSSSLGVQDFIQKTEARCEFPSKVQLRGLWRFEQGTVHVVTFEIQDGSDYGTTSYAVYKNNDEHCRLSPVQHRRYIAAVDYQSEKRAVVTASGDNNIVVWHMDQDEELDVFSHGWHVRNVAFIGPERIITHTESGDVWVWDTQSDAEILRLNGTQEEKMWFETNQTNGILIFKPNADGLIESYSLTDAESMPDTTLRKHLCDVLNDLAGEERSQVESGISRLGYDPCAERT